MIQPDAERAIARKIKAKTTWPSVPKQLRCCRTLKVTAMSF